MGTTKKYRHSLSDICKELDEKIAALRGLKTIVQARIRADVGVQMNSEALRQISASLAHARDARAALDESCCGQGCDIDYED